MFTPDGILLVPILLPLLGAVLLPLISRYGSRVRNTLVVGSVAGSLATLLRLVNTDAQAMFFRFIEYELGFGVTPFGLLMAIAATTLWLLAVIYSFAYMKQRPAQDRFYAFLLASLTGCLGVFMARDYITLFLFFELMTFATYPLVIHDEDKEAFSAGDMYLYVSVAGGLVLLFGIFLLVWVTGSAEIAPALELLIHGEVSAYIIAAAFLTGFGVKAGLIPLHVWLPQAYKVTPSPAIAVSSGVMIKTGAYGILRVLTTTFAPAGEAIPEMLLVPQNIGYVLVWVAIVTLIGGALMALMQDNPKKLLAYSSISQMGYIMLAAGSAAYLSTSGGLAYTGAVFHMLNHSIFKAGLFMMLGMVLLSTQVFSISRLGGMRRYLPFTALVTLIAALAVLGIPGTNGFASKTLVHEAIVEAAYYSGSPWLKLAEKLFKLGSALTAAYFVKLYWGVFGGDYRGKGEPDGLKEPFIVKAVLGTFALAILAIGFRPHAVISRWVQPAAGGTGINLELLSEQLNHVQLWDWHAYEGVVLPAAAGFVIYLLAKKLGFFDWRYPKWLSVEACFYRPVAQGFLFLVSKHVAAFEGRICQAYDKSGSFSEELINRARHAEDFIESGYHAVEHATEQLTESARSIEDSVGEVYEQASRSVEQLREAMDQRPARRQRWNPTNISLSSLLVATLLLVFLFVLYYFGGNLL